MYFCFVISAHPDILDLIADSGSYYANRKQQRSRPQYSRSLGKSARSAYTLRSSEPAYAYAHLLAHPNSISELDARMGRKNKHKVSVAAAKLASIEVLPQR